MWVRTQDDELVNLEHIEYVLVEEDDEGAAFELRAYSIGWEPEGEGEFYTLSSATTDVEATRSMDRLFSSLQAGDSTIDFRDPASAQWASGFPSAGTT
jgi:hypothetical protein